MAARVCVWGEGLGTAALRGRRVSCSWADFPQRWAQALAATASSTLSTNWCLGIWCRVPVGDCPCFSQAAANRLVLLLKG